MKRLPLASSILVFVLLCVSISFWGIRIFTPQNRSVAMPSQQESIEPGAGQWGGLFGNNQTAQIAATNYQLKGVILARKSSESLAIVVDGNKPAQTVSVGKEFTPGVVLKEVHEQYVLISESNVLRRIDLPQNATINVSSIQRSSFSPPVAPPAFPAHAGALALPNPPVATPGLPAASLPSVMPGSAQ